MNPQNAKSELATGMIFVCRILPLLLLLPTFAFAAFISSTSDGGNWSNTATWENGVIPGEGDVAEIRGQVIVDENITVGASPNSGSLDAIQVLNTGSLAIGSGITLTSRGNIWVSNASVILNAGARLEFDGSVKGIRYEFTLAKPGAMLQINGTVTAHCMIFSNMNGPNAYINGSRSEGSILASYCDFLRLGSSDPVLPSLWWAPVDNTEITLHHCTFMSCSYLHIADPSAQSVVDIQYCTWTDSFLDKCVKIDSLIAKTQGLRKFFRCWFDKNFALGASKDITLQENVFYGGIWNAGYNKRWALFDSNLVRLQAPQSIDMTADGDMKNVYFLHDGEGAPVKNPHYAFIAKNLPGEVIVENCVFECPFYDSTTDAGDCILIDSGETIQTVMMKRCIGLPVDPTYTGSDTNSPGTAFSIFSSSSKIDFKFNKNTFYGGLPRGICMMGEGVGPFYGTVSSFKDNLLWDNIESGSERAFAISTQATNAINHFLPDGATNNGWWRLRKTENQSDMSSQGTIYNVPTTVTIPGANDINADPEFVDPTRNFASWAVNQGSTSTTKAGQISDGLNYLKSDLNLLTKPNTGLLDWVRCGFLPTNPAFMGKASDKTVIGAISNGVVYISKNDPECKGNKPCYVSIQAGIDAASTGSSIKIAEGNYTELITLNTSKNLILKGGWNESFTLQTPNRTIIRSPTAPQGSLTIQMLNITP